MLILCNLHSTVVCTLEINMLFIDINFTQIQCKEYQQQYCPITEIPSVDASQKHYLLWLHRERHRVCQAEPLIFVLICQILVAQPTVPYKTR